MVHCTCYILFFERMTNDTDGSLGFMNMVKVGHPVPDFEFEVFQDDKVKKVRLSDYKNKWLVLFFYPADFTFVCPTELEELAQQYDQFKKLGAEIISMSTDTVFTHKAWHDASPSIQKITFPMGADPSGRIGSAFGVTIDNIGLDHVDDEGLTLRGTFIIDPDSVVRTVEIHDNGIGRSGKELLRKVQAAQFVKTHGGQVCPAEWNPGDDTLKHGDMDLVGKI